MSSNIDIQNGWEFAAKLVGASYGTDAAAKYISKVEEAIRDLEKGIIDLKCNQGDAQLGGFIAEEWAARTFNIDAIARGSDSTANRLGVNGYGSVDIETNFGQDYSSKYISTAEKSATEQSLLNRDTNEPLYKGQKRLVPSDQYLKAKEYASNQAGRNIESRPEVSAAYQDASENMVDRISDGNGTESKPLSKKDSIKIARDVKKDQFEAKKYGVDLDSVIKTEYIIKHALEAGFSAAAISMAMQITPEIIKSIDYLVKHGELDFNQVKQLGTKAISSGVEGFLRGSIACTLQIYCEQGLLGEAFVDANPTVVGAVVAIVLQTAKNSILVAAGKMTVSQLGSSFVDSVIVSSGFLAGVKIGQAVGGTIGQTIGFTIPGLGYALGSLIGCTCSIMYQVGKRQFISFCVDTGFTCFGLVDQDYEMPAEYLRQLGVEMVYPDFVEPDFVEPDFIEPDYIEPDFDTPETVEFYEIKRGVIGVNKIGYVLM